MWITKRRIRLTIKPKVWATRSDVMDQQQDLGAIMYVNFPWDSPV